MALQGRVDCEKLVDNKDAEIVRLKNDKDAEIVRLKNLRFRIAKYADYMEDYVIAAEAAKKTAVKARARCDARNDSLQADNIRLKAMVLIAGRRSSNREVGPSVKAPSNSRRSSIPPPGLQQRHPPNSPKNGNASYYK